MYLHIYKRTRHAVMYLSTVIIIIFHQTSGTNELNQLKYTCTTFFFLLPHVQLYKIDACFVMSTCFNKTMQKFTCYRVFVYTGFNGSEFDIVNANDMLKIAVAR